MVLDVGQDTSFRPVRDGIETVGLVVDCSSALDESAPPQRIVDPLTPGDPPAVEMIAHEVIRAVEINERHFSHRSAKRTA